MASGVLVDTLNVSLPEAKTAMPRGLKPGEQAAVTGHVKKPSPPKRLTYAPRPPRLEKVHIRLFALAQDYDCELTVASPRDRATRPRFVECRDDSELALLRRAVLKDAVAGEAW